MSGTPRNSPAILISGDTLALDPAIRTCINEEAQRLKERHPTKRVTLRIVIGEEFDQVNGHRVRCELAADLPGRKLMVREARKEASAAITAVFAAARRQLRRMRSRDPEPESPAGGGVQPAGT
jgi:ribosome-associated translation inhibitor RaiA